MEDSKLINVICLASGDPFSIFRPCWMGYFLPSKITTLHFLSLQVMSNLSLEHIALVLSIGGIDEGVWLLGTELIVL